jgi:hypothetical protein
MNWFARKRSDTLTGTIEDTYNINLNTRRDTLLGNLLDDRGFDSLTQLLQAYRGNLREHARKRRIFLSFHYEDVAQVRGFRLMAHNPGLDIEFHDGSIREPVASERSAYIKQVIREKISKASVVLCLVGNGTAWRDWVDWELDTARRLHKGLCGVRLKGARGRSPDLLRELDAFVASWGDTGDIIAAVESAAARRS